MQNYNMGGFIRAMLIVQHITLKITDLLSEKRGLSRVLISTAGHRSFLRKTGIISGAYFYCWRVEISTRDNPRFSEKTSVASSRNKHPR
jgi:hypothetical protein